MFNIIRGLRYFFKMNLMEYRSRDYDNNLSLEVNPKTGEVHFKPKWYKLVYMIIFTYRTLKACITWNWNFSEDWLFSNKNKKGFIDYYLYDNYQEQKK